MTPLCFRLSISPKLFELETSMLLLDVLLTGLLSTSGNHIRELSQFFLHRLHDSESFFNIHFSGLKFNFQISIRGVFKAKYAAKCKTMDRLIDLCSMPGYSSNVYEVNDIIFVF